jgi:hypothetical protein
MYSIKYGRVEKKTAKGISKSAMRNIRHEEYKKCLFNQEISKVTVKQIRSYNHQLYNVSLNKIGLSPFDDKRYVLDDGFNTQAHGHYSMSIK